MYFVCKNTGILYHYTVHFKIEKNADFQYNVIMTNRAYNNLYAKTTTTRGNTHKKYHAFCNGK